MNLSQFIATLPPSLPQPVKAAKIAAFLANQNAAPVQQKTVYQAPAQTQSNVPWYRQTQANDAETDIPTSSLLKKTIFQKAE